MVRLVVVSLEQVLPPCFARPMLYRAHDALQRGDLIAAGCRLREAVRRLLYSQCEFHHCLPKKSKIHHPRQLANALLQNGYCGEGVHGWLIEIIEAGNAAAHCKPATAQHLGDCISLLHAILNSATGCHEFKREGGAS